MSILIAMKWRENVRHYLNTESGQQFPFGDPLAPWKNAALHDTTIRCLRSGVFPSLLIKTVSGFLHEPNQFLTHLTFSFKISSLNDI